MSSDKSENLSQIELQPQIKSDSLIDIQNPTEDNHQTLLHDTAHVLASALKKIYGDAIKITIGPSIKNGFYYDVDLDTKISPADFPQIEKEMMKIAKDNKNFIKEEWTKEKALEYFSSIGETYKVELIQGINDRIFVYRNGDFIDLCKGPHLTSTRYVRHFKLLKVAGAYWRGSSKNKMLQRIYGTSFFTKEALEQYLFLQEEALKRDHRKLGKELKLFHLQDCAQGSPFWHPKGWTINTIIEKYIRQMLKEDGYKEVKTPILYDRILWEKSGHWEKFSENMFSFKEKNDYINPAKCENAAENDNIEHDLTVANDNENSIKKDPKLDTNISQDEDACHLQKTQGNSKDLVLKPMNCPAHVQIFNQEIRSYRDLPLRFSEFGICHRNEPTGALYGLMRVRSFRQDDGHIFCRFDQIKDETTKFIHTLMKIYEKFGFKDTKIKFSDRPSVRAGNDEVWDIAEFSLLDALNSMNLQYELNKGEGAFYGPKLEFTLIDALGREWQCGTVQIDMVLPDRLGAKYINEHGDKTNCVMIHRAVLGSFERFIGILIEHYSGKFPFWLSPVQIAILKVSDDIEEINNYAKGILSSLEKNFRVEMCHGNDRITKKVAQMLSLKIPVLIIIGKEEVEKSLVTLRINNIKSQIELQDLNVFLHKLQS